MAIWLLMYCLLYIFPIIKFVFKKTESLLFIVLDLHIFNIDTEWRTELGNMKLCVRDTGGSGISGLL